MSIDHAIEAIESFQGASLTASLSGIETQIVGLGLNEVQNFCGSRGIDDAFLASALSIKKIAGQVNVIIHAAGILRSLQSIMESGEVVENVTGIEQHGIQDKGRTANHHLIFFVPS